MTFDRLLRTVRLRLRSLLFGTIDLELAEELQNHIEQQTDENIARGMRPDEARMAALRAFGGVEHDDKPY